MVTDVLTGKILHSSGETDRILLLNEHIQAVQFTAISGSMNRYQPFGEPLIAVQRTADSNKNVLKHNRSLVYYIITLMTNCGLKEMRHAR